jgi:cob(I)alamin adenosyltransferase
MPKLKKPDPNKPMIPRKGLVICYIGDGKGKTSAAMGLAARATGAGMKVFILQFVKSQRPSEDRKLEPGEWPISNEILFFEKHGIDTDQVGLGFVGILGDQKERAQHEREALKGLELARQIVSLGKYQVVILDEIISALELNLIEESDILDLIASKPEMLHLVITGHNKYPKIIKACDLVTEMKMVKHPYYNNILAQRGIDY